MIGSRKLATEKNKHGRTEKHTFGAFWFVNAATTFLFGYFYLDPLFYAILSPLPIGETALVTVSRILGGGVALLMLDWAYPQWEQIKLYGSETDEQTQAAQSAENMAFWMSITFTATSLMSLVFGWLLNDQLINLIEWFGAVAFVGVCIGHLIFMQRFKANSIQTREAADRAARNGQHNSEKLSFRADANRDALRQAADQATARLPEIVERLAADWENDLLRSIINQIGVAQQPPTLPPPSPTYTVLPQPPAAIPQSNAARQPVAQQQPVPEVTEPPQFQASADGVSVARLVDESGSVHYVWTENGRVYAGQPPEQKTSENGTNYDLTGIWQD